LLRQKSRYLVLKSFWAPTIDRNMISFIIAIAIGKASFDAKKRPSKKAYIASLLS